MNVEFVCRTFMILQWGQPELLSRCFQVKGYIATFQLLAWLGDICFLLKAVSVSYEMLIFWLNIVRGVYLSNTQTLCHPLRIMTAKNNWVEIFNNGNAEMTWVPRLEAFGTSRELSFKWFSCCSVPPQGCRRLAGGTQGNWHPAIFCVWPWIILSVKHSWDSLSSISNCFCFSQSRFPFCSLGICVGGGRGGVCEGGASSPGVSEHLLLTISYLLLRNSCGKGNTFIFQWK